MQIMAMKLATRCPSPQPADRSPRSDDARARLHEHANAVDRRPGEKARQNERGAITTRLAKYGGVEAPDLRPHAQRRHDGDGACGLAQRHGEKHHGRRRRHMEQGDDGQAGAEDRAGELRRRIGPDAVLRTRPFAVVGDEQARDEIGGGGHRGHGVGDDADHHEAERREGDLRGGAVERHANVHGAKALFVLALVALAKPQYVERPPDEPDQRGQFLRGDDEGDDAEGSGIEQVRPGDDDGELHERPENLGRKIEQGVSDERARHHGRPGASR
ncbi:MAG: hypothetical protein V9G24_00505 [Rhodoblastus sp.]